MTTHKEALTLALEALKNFGQENSDVCKAIKEALVQPEHEKYCPICQGVGQVDTGIMESPVTICNACNGTGLKAQPEQRSVSEHLEPVATVGDLVPSRRWNLELPEDAKLYTAPPYVPTERQRTWVGLTDEEIDQGLLRSDYAFKTAEAWRAGVVFAMTKLKEKNCG